MLDEPEMAFQALSSSAKVWEDAMKRAFAADGLTTVLEADPIFGASKSEDLAKEARVRAKHALDMVLSTQPFAEMNEESIRNNSARALDFPDITSAATADELTTKMDDPDNREVMPLVAELGVDAAGNSTSLVDASEKLAIVIDALKKIDERAAAANAGGPVQPVASVIASIKNVNDFKEMTQLTDADIGRMVTPGAADHDANETTKIAERWQKARTILETARAFDMVKAGGVFPKAWEALVPKWTQANLGAGWGPKVHKADLPRLGSSQLVVWPVTSVQARSVSVRKAQRLPLTVPRRRHDRSV